MKRAYAYLGWTFVTAWLLMTALFSVALNDDLYDFLQRLSGVDEQVCGLSDEDRLTLNRDTAMFLAGRADDIPSLSERARVHMEDVRGLFETAKTVMYICFAAGAVFGALALIKSADTVRRAYFTVIAAFAVICVTVGIWAALDFGSLFTAFHGLLFSNDFWILDPDADALIRVLPAKFFALAAATVVIRAALRILLAGAAVRLIKGLIRRLNA